MSEELTRHISNHQRIHLDSVGRTVSDASLAIQFAMSMDDHGDAVEFLDEWNNDSPRLDDSEEWKEWREWRLGHEALS